MTPRILRSHRNQGSPSQGKSVTATVKERIFHNVETTIEYFPSLFVVTYHGQSPYATMPLYELGVSNKYICYCVVQLSLWLVFTLNMQF